jgi:hypothetical protein
LKVCKVLIGPISSEGKLYEEGSELIFSDADALLYERLTYVQIVGDPVVAKQSAPSEQPAVTDEPAEDAVAEIKAVDPTPEPSQEGSKSRKRKSVPEESEPS